MCLISFRSSHMNNIISVKATQMIPGMKLKSTHTIIIYFSDYHRWWKRYDKGLIFIQIQAFISYIFVIFIIYTKESMELNRITK